MTKLFAILLLIVVFLGGIGLYSFANTLNHSKDSTADQPGYNSSDGQNNPTEPTTTDYTNDTSTNAQKDPNIDPSTQSTTGQIYPNGQSHPAYTDVNGNFHAAFTSNKDYYDQHDPGEGYPHSSTSSNYTQDHPENDPDIDPNPSSSYYGGSY